MNILVVGDSWGVGEWPDGPRSDNTVYHDYEQIEHKGLCQYLEEAGHNVINLSKSGATNSYIRWVINFYLQRISKNIDLVYVFLTSFATDENIDNFNKSDMFSELLDQYETNIIFELSKICQRYNVKINIIGGSSDAFSYENLEKDFPGVSVVCQSFMNLLFYQNPNIDFPIYGLHWTKADGGTFKDKVFERFTDKDFCLDYLTGWKSKVDLLDTPSTLHTKYFKPDGGHPNRHGHKVLFDYLLENDRWLNKEKK